MTTAETSAAQPPSETAAPMPLLTFAFRGQGSSLFFLILKNAFLTLITLGIYAAWARTERRKYMWSNVEIDGQRLQYTGTGGELFVGYLKVLGAYVAFLAIMLMANAVAPEVGKLVQGLLGLGVLILMPFAIYWSRRYLLSRTKWRGIRLGLVGEAKTFAWMFIKGTLLTFVTLGLYAPVFGNRVYKALMNNTRYGNTPFSYTGRDGEVWRLTMKGLLLSIITLGIYSFWFRAALQRYRMAHTHFDGATASLRLSGGQLLGYTLMSGFLTPLTLGIAFPWIVVYILKRIVGGMSMHGHIDFTQIMQRVSAGDAAADGLADVVGVELGI